MTDRWRWDNLSATVSWRVNNWKPSLYERNRIRLPYMAVYSPIAREFFYVNRDYKQLDVRKEQCSFQHWPCIAADEVRHHFYSDDNAPRTKRTTEQLLKRIQNYNESHLAGFTERTDFTPLDGVQ